MQLTFFPVTKSLHNLQLAPYITPQLTVTSRNEENEEIT